MIQQKSSEKTTARPIWKKVNMEKLIRVNMLYGISVAQEASSSVQKNHVSNPHPIGFE